MAARLHSALTPPPFRPTWELFASLGLHALLVAGVFLGEAILRPPRPMIDPADVMMVQAVALPKQTKRLPDKPMRTPDPPQAAPTPTPSPTPPPPPTASDMVLKKDDAPPPPKGEPEAPKDRTADREALMRQAQREQLLKDMAAAVGPKDQVQTSPDGVDPADAILGSGVGTPMDPELARYIAACRNAILPNWTPLPATLSAHPDYKVLLLVTVSETGAIGEPELYKGSGDPSFDRSGVLAVVKTGKLPAPPAKYRASAAKGVIITLAARDL